MKTKPGRLLIALLGALCVFGAALVLMQGRDGIEPPPRLSRDGIEPPSRLSHLDIAGMVVVPFPSLTCDEVRHAYRHMQFTVINSERHVIVRQDLESRGEAVPVAGGCEFRAHYEVSPEPYEAYGLVVEDFGSLDRLGAVQWITRQQLEAEDFVNDFRLDPKSQGLAQG